MVVKNYLLKNKKADFELDNLGKIILAVIILIVLITIITVSIKSEFSLQFVNLKSALNFF